MELQLYFQNDNNDGTTKPILAFSLLFDSSGDFDGSENKFLSALKLGSISEKKAEVVLDPKTIHLRDVRNIILTW